MLWIKAFHIVFMVTWFAGLFYLPRLFVYHAQAEDAVSLERYSVMERKLFSIMTIGAVGTLVFGVWLLMELPQYLQSGWLHAKLVLVLGLVAYHAYLGRLCRGFKSGINHHGHVYYRWINELPAFFLVTIVILVVVKPF